MGQAQQEEKAEKKKGFLAKLMDKLDKKLEEKSKESSCCCGGKDGKGGACS
ncbi:MAG: hypothetical protein Q8Q08_10230 [Candidatus Omnitrophota bacterium]|nr:hypothetical protein [Candidatus Omnitrophota bacterium]MDZ4241576.1 hypothetical protein [Candidatus Omnitrophota bacterium]